MNKQTDKDLKAMLIITIISILVTPIVYHILFLPFGWWINQILYGGKTMEWELGQKKTLQKVLEDMKRENVISYYLEDKKTDYGAFKQGL